MKRHYWQYLIDGSGNAVEGARIHVFLANSNVYAWIYTSGFGSPTTTEFTEIVTDSNGYFDFWIATKVDSVVYGYENTNRFRITWSKAGLLSGGLADVDIVWGGTDGSGVLSINKEYESDSLVVNKSSYTSFTLNTNSLRFLVYRLEVEASGITDLYDIEFWNSDYTVLFYQATNISPLTNWIDIYPFYYIDDLSNGDMYCKIRNTDSTNQGNFVINLSYEEFSPGTIDGDDTYKVKIDISDTEDYLGEKLIAGDGITITPSGGKLIISTS